MEWIFLCFLFLFVAHSLTIQPLYEKTDRGREEVVIDCCDQKLINYQGEMRTKIEHDLDALYGEIDSLQLVHPRRPEHWQTKLLTPQDRFVRPLSTTIFILFAVALVMTTDANLPWDERFAHNIRAVVVTLAPFSVFAALYWRHRRSYNDGMTQGYIDGYMHALEQIYTQRSKPQGHHPDA